MFDKMGFIFYGKHPLLVIRIQVGDSGPMGPHFFLAHLSRSDKVSFSDPSSSVVCPSFIVIRLLTDVLNETSKLLIGV